MYCKNAQRFENFEGPPTYRVVQKKVDLEEKCLRNSKIFFDGVSLSMYSHLVKKLELSKLCRNIMGL